MKQAICTMAGIVGSTIAALFGGWDEGLATLIIFMTVDYISGLIVAGVFHTSTKTDSGALSSRAGWKGICKKWIKKQKIKYKYSLSTQLIFVCCMI